MQITVKDRQSLADIAVQYLGGVEGIFALAERNGISITAKLKDGQTLDWELADTVDATVQKTYAAQGIEPATDIPQKEMEALLLSFLMIITYIPAVSMALPNWLGMS